MKGNFQLTYRQLYYLAKTLGAKYIDFAYLFPVEKLLDNFGAYENEIRDELIAMEYLTEDFSGEVVIDEKLKDILEPVFFSAKESSVEVCFLTEEPYVEKKRFHITKGSVVLVRNEDDHLVVSYTNREKVEEILSSIVPTSYSCEGAREIERLIPDQITEMITVKSADPNDKCITKTFVKTGDFWYEEDSDSKLKAVSRDKIIADAEQVVLGVM